jgi:CRISPR-associated endonuclease/helicase Cas3
MDGWMKETSYFEQHKKEYEKYSHPGKPLSLHCTETEDYSTELLHFYNIGDEISSAITEFLSYYHDLGKLDPDWSCEATSRPFHSPRSVSRLLKDQVLLESRKELTPIIYYMILKHHGKLKPPREVDNAWTNLRDFDSLFRFLKAKNLREYLCKFDTNATKLADVFGIFKIADALSATETKHHQTVRDLMVEKPNYSVGDVRALIKSGFDLSLWEKQLQIRNLPKIALLRAPTGWGKTTVALLHPINKHPSRVFVLLPTITAINKYYTTLQERFGNEVKKVFYFYDTEIKEDEEKLATLFFANCFLAPIVITTIDQFLLSFLQCGRYHTRRVAFRNSAIILDEVHLLNPVMLRLLTYFVNSYKSDYNLKLLCMSATLPRALMEYLRDELNLSPSARLDFGDEYKKRKKRIRFDLTRSDIATSVNEVRREYEKGKKILVILNTVKKAIEFRKRLGNMVEVQTLHARFMYCDRRSKERKLEELASRPHVLVATQICEVSLDVSYQSLYTEAAPLSAMIQRFGRVNRKSEVEVDKCNVHLFLSEAAGKSEYYPYEPSDIADCWHALETLEGPLLKNEWQLIEEFDKSMTYDKFKDELHKVADRRLDMDAWEEILQKFYCIDASERSLMEILEYRDSFTTLALPHPEMIQDDSRQEKMRKLLDDLNKARCKTEWKKWQMLSASAKEMSIPVPLRWIRKYPPENNIFPVARFPDTYYSLDLGLVSENE